MPHIVHLFLFLFFVFNWIWDSWVCLNILASVKELFLTFSLNEPHSSVKDTHNQIDKTGFQMVLFYPGQKDLWVVCEACTFGFSFSFGCVCFGLSFCSSTNARQSPKRLYIACLNPHTTTHALTVCHDFHLLFSRFRLQNDLGGFGKRHGLIWKRASHTTSPLFLPYWAVNPTAANDRFVVHKPEKDLPLIYIILNAIQHVIEKNAHFFPPICMIKASAVFILHFTMKPAGCKQGAHIVS